MTEKSSKELAIPTTDALCEGLIRLYGTDRSNDERMLYDADLEVTDVDGQELKARLYQIGGVGLQAVYLLKTRSVFEKGESLYRYDVDKGELTQRTRKQDGEMTEPLEIEPQALDNLLHTVEH